MGAVKVLVMVVHPLVVEVEALPTFVGLLTHSSTESLLVGVVGAELATFQVTISLVLVEMAGILLG
jgi:hypothetical protein